MKTFNSLRELIEYIKYCPVCFSKRELILNLGPENELILMPSHDDGDVFQIDGIHKKSSIPFRLSINLDSNEFEIISEAQFIKSIQFYFYLYAHCNNMFDNHICNCCVNSSDIEFNYLNKLVENFSIEYESVWLTRTEHPLHISIHSEDMKVTKLSWEHGELIDNSGEVSLPPVDFDFADEQKVVQKIRTMLVFS